MTSPTTFNIARFNIDSIEPDLPSIKLASNVVSDGDNMRYRDNAIEAFSGYAQIYSNLSFTPLYLLPLRRPTGNIWIAGGVSKVVSISASGVETDITHASGVTSTQDDNWIGDTLNGLPFIGCNLNDPMYWDGNILNNLLTLPGWQAGYSAKSFRAYKNFIVALDVTHAGGSFPNMVKWSESADSGSVPGSWDETDPTKNAGEVLIGDRAGRNVDCLPLGGDNIVYKEHSTYLMQFIGGQFIFSFREIFHTSGILTQNCVVEVENKHVVLTKQDIIMHDGRTIQSIGDNRIKRYIFDQLNTASFENSYVVHYPKDYEVWFCVPYGSATLPEEAVVWNYRHDKFGIRVLPGSPHIARGNIDQVTADLTWAADTENWDQDMTIWNQQYSKSAAEELVMLDGVKLQQMNTGVIDDATTINGYVEKRSLVVDPEAKNVTFVRAIIPYITAPAGKIVYITLGSQMYLTDPVAWGTEREFTVGAKDRLDYMIKGRYISIKLRASCDAVWRVEEIGFEFNLNERY